mmetsp:Transcript_21135/g.59471  ORF Transcript_21135/g.59471 Transcript_21135/m.59471 type:complete len:541 (+) Transcript_21135:357-1979(+)
MYVVLNVLGHVEVDHVLDVGEVKSLRGHVRSDEHVLVPRLELADGLLTLVLKFTTVHGYGLNALHKEILVDVVHIAFVLRKDKYRRGRLLQALEEVHNLRLLLDKFDLLDNVEVRGARAAHVHHDGLHQGAAGKVLDLPGHGGREEERLALRREEVHNVPNLLLETQVDQAVRFVEAKVPARVQSELLLVEHVLQAPRCCHRHVDTVPQQLILLPHVDSTHAQHGVELRVAVLLQRAREFAHHLVRLPRQLARRAEAQPHRPLPTHQRELYLIRQCRHHHGQYEHQRIVRHQKRVPQHEAAVSVQSESKVLVHLQHLHGKRLPDRRPAAPQHHGLAGQSVQGALQHNRPVPLQPRPKTQRPGHKRHVRHAGRVSQEQGARRAALCRVPARVRHPGQEVPSRGLAPGAPGPGSGRPLRPHRVPQCTPPVQPQCFARHLDSQRRCPRAKPVPDLSTRAGCLRDRRRRRRCRPPVPGRVPRNCDRGRVGRLGELEGATTVRTKPRPHLHGDAVGVQDVTHGNVHRLAGGEHPLPHPQYRAGGG